MSKIKIVQGIEIQFDGCSHVDRFYTKQKAIDRIAKDINMQIVQYCVDSAYNNYVSCFFVKMNGIITCRRPIRSDTEIMNNKTFEATIGEPQSWNKFIYNDTDEEVC